MSTEPHQEQQPLELILARNLMSSILTPALLVDTNGLLVFFNEAAGQLLGRRFEEAGKMPWEQWGSQWGPLDDAGDPIPFEDLPLTVALRKGCPAHHRVTIRSGAGELSPLEVSAFPLVSTDGSFRGALALFWPETGDGSK